MPQGHRRPGKKPTPFSQAAPWRCAVSVVLHLWLDAPTGPLEPASPFVPRRAPGQLAVLPTQIHCGLSANSPWNLRLIPNGTPWHPDGWGLRSGPSALCTQILWCPGQRYRWSPEAARSVSPPNVGLWLTDRNTTPSSSGHWDSSPPWGIGSRAVSALPRIRRTQDSPLHPCLCQET
jgi:hypothetical protein